MRRDHPLAVRISHSRLTRNVAQAVQPAASPFVATFRATADGRARPQVSRRLSTRQAGQPAPHRRPACETCGLILSRDRANERRDAGVTLIELLIAVTLTAAISVGLLLAMRVSLLTYEKLNQRLEDNRYAVGIQQTLERQISGVIPIVGDCGAVHVPVFSGGPQSLRLLSNYSLAEGSRGYPRIIEYQVAPDPRGGVRLMMNERLYGGVATVAPLCSGNALLPVQLDGQSIEAVGRLAFCSLEYHEYIPEAPLQGNWVPAWNRPALPGAVRIQMAALPEGPARLPVLTLEVPLRISRDLGAAYVDQ